MEEIRLSVFSDVPFLKEMWKTSFGDTNEYIEMIFKNLYAPQNAMVLTVNGEIVSCLYICPENLVIGGKIKTAFYIMGVATAREHREKGYMARLFEFALKEIKSRGGAFAYLIPVNKGIYEKFGFEPFFAEEEWEYAKKSGTISAEIINENNIEKVKKLYISYTRDVDCAVTRSDAFWKCILSEYRGALLNDSYMFYFETDDKITVFEIFGEKDKLLLYFGKTNKKIIIKTPLKDFKKGSMLGMIKPLDTDFKKGIKTTYMGLMLN